MGWFRRGFFYGNRENRHEAWEGEESKRQPYNFSGYSATAQRTGKPSYLEPTSQSMQKTVEGVYSIRVFRSQWHVEKAVRVYLERIRDSLQKPIEGLSSLYVDALNKGGVQFPSTTDDETLKRTPQTCR